MPGQAIDAGQRLLIGQMQRLMAGEELGLADLGRGFRRHAAGGHEIQRLAEPVGQLGIALAERAVGDEIEIPAMHAVQIGEAALGEGAQQVERRRRLVIGLHQALGIGHARGGRELDAVDVVAAIARQLDAADRLHGCRARLGELAGHPADLHHRHGGAEGQHHRHLQQHAEGVADVVGAELGEALGAIPALQQEAAALGHLAQRLHQPARLAGKDQRADIRAADSPPPPASPDRDNRGSAGRACPASSPDSICPPCSTSGSNEPDPIRPKRAYFNQARTGSPTRRGRTFAPSGHAIEAGARRSTGQPRDKPGHDGGGGSAGGAGLALSYCTSCPGCSARP